MATFKLKPYWVHAVQASNNGELTTSAGTIKFHSTDWIFYLGRTVVAIPNETMQHIADPADELTADMLTVRSREKLFSTLFNHSMDPTYLDGNYVLTPFCQSMSADKRNDVEAAAFAQTMLAELEIPIELYKKAAK